MLDGELVVLDDNGRSLFNNVVGVVVGCPSALTPAVEKTFTPASTVGPALVRCKNDLRFALVSYINRNSLASREAGPQLTL